MRRIGSEQRSRHALRAGAFAAAFAVALSACGGGRADPSQALADALDGLRSGVAFALSVDIDPAFRDRVTAEDPDAAQFFGVAQGGRITGRATSSGVELTVQLLGGDLFSLRAVDQDALYVRIDPNLLSQLSEGGFDPQQLLGQLSGLPPQLQPVVQALLGGQWVGVTGLQQLAGQLPTGGLTPAPEATAFAAALEAEFGDLRQVVDRYLEVTERSREGDRQVLDVRIRLRALLQRIAELAGESPEAPPVPLPSTEDLSDVPELVGGITVTLTGGDVTEIAFDVGETAASVGGEVPEGLEPGAVVVRIEFSEHGAVEPVEAPEGAVTIGADELGALFGTLLFGELGGGFPMTPPGVPMTPPGSGG